MASGLNEDLVALEMSDLLTDLCATYSVPRPALVVNENPNHNRRHTVKGYARKVPSNGLGMFIPKQPGRGQHTILITRFDRARETLVHEFGHYLVQLRHGIGGHGPTFVAIFRELCELYGLEPTWCCERGL